MLRLKMARWLLLALGFALVPLAQAQYYSSLRGMLNQYISLVDEQCARILPNLEQDAEGDAHKTLMAGQVKQNLCQCNPEKARALLTRLSEEQLAAQLYDEAEFLAIMKPNVLAPCSGELWRGLFQGDLCQKLWGAKESKAHVDVDTFCPCMRVEMPNYSDDDSMNLGLEYADYIPAAAAADKEGKPRPSRSPLLARFTESLKKCGAKGPMVD